MKLHECKLLLVSVGLIGIIVLSYPALAVLIQFQPDKQFSELYLLGPERTASDYPFNVVPDHKYTVYVNVGNHLGSSAHYLVYVKLLNTSDPMPIQAPSPVSPLFELRLLVSDGQAMGSQVKFSLGNISVANSQLTVGTVHLNGLGVNVNKSSVWNTTTSTYPYIVLFELWMLNIQTGFFEYTNRFVTLQLNCTSAII